MANPPARPIPTPPPAPVWQPVPPFIREFVRECPSKVVVTAWPTPIANPGQKTNGGG